MLGPAKSTTQVFERLDRQNCKLNKSAIWFLPFNQPTAPHLDELLGPLPVKGKERLNAEIAEKFSRRTDRQAAQSTLRRVKPVRVSDLTVLASA